MSNLARTSSSYFPAPFSIFDDFFNKDLFNWTNQNHSGGNTLPAINITETNDDFCIDVAAPGMSKDDFKIQLDNGLLVIKGEKKHQNEQRDNQGNLVRKEFNYQNFTRSFNLHQESVIPDQISAKYENGILKLCIPKTEEAKTKPVKEIEIT